LCGRKIFYIVRRKNLYPYQFRCTLKQNTMKKFFRFLSSVLLLSAAFPFSPLHPQARNSVLPEFMVWDTQGSFNDKPTDEEIEAYLKRFTDHNIKGMFLGAKNEFYKRIIPIAKKVGLQIHAWRPTMINFDSVFMNAHKDWYAVNKNKESCLGKPPYVGYYRWFCPNEPEVVRYLVDEYVELAKIEGIAGIHLDYIRYCDIFLPAGLQPKYNLVQDHEMPEYDYCYCYRCREGFKKAYGRDPMEIGISDSSGQRQWKEWRLKAIVNIVDTITKEVKAKTGKYVTAAVFPTPKMSVDMVRQDWSLFKIDAVCPMLYNDFYYKGIDWIGECVKKGIATMTYKKDLHAGIMVNHVAKPEQFTKAIQVAFENGARGAVFFTGKALTDEQLKIIKEYK